MLQMVSEGVAYLCSFFLTYLYSIYYGGSTANQIPEEKGSRLAHRKP